MSDKVPLSERLKDPEFRKKVKHAGIRLDLEDQKWMMEEVERLRAALRDLLEWLGEDYTPGDDDPMTRARAALEEK